MLRFISWLVVLQSVLCGILVTGVIQGTYGGITTFGRVFATVIAGLLPILASFIATRNQRIAARMYLSAAPIGLLLILLFSRELGGVLWTIAVFSGALLIPGLFWLLAARRNRPPLLPRLFFTRYPWLTAALGTGFSGVLIVIVLLLSLSLPWWPPIGDCSGGRPILDERGVPRELDFTARIIFVGPLTYRGKSLWSIAHIEERFSGSPLAASEIVILRGFFDPGDEFKRYFVEGGRSGSTLTRFLPVIEPTPCGHTAPIPFAAVSLRILHDGPPKTEARLIGSVYQGDPWNWNARKPVPGVRISINGPSGRIVSVTDATGIYDATGLSPGRYTIELLVKDQYARTSYAVDLNVSQIKGQDFYLR